MPKITRTPKQCWKDKEDLSPKGSMGSTALLEVSFQPFIFMVSAKTAKESNISARSHSLTNIM